MPYIIQDKQHKDCVIVALANYTGRSYDDCMLAAIMSGLEKDRILKKGTPTSHIPVIIAHLLGKIPRVSSPKRGHENLTGLVEWHRIGVSNGHLSVAIDGTIYDTDGKVMPIKRYAFYHKMVIRKVYQV